MIESHHIYRNCLSIVGVLIIKLKKLVSLKEVLQMCQIKP